LVPKNFRETQKNQMDAKTGWTHYSDGRIIRMR
jgi:hypothetical protein